MTEPVRGRAPLPPAYNEALEKGAARAHYEDIPIREPAHDPSPLVERLSRPQSTSARARIDGLWAAARFVGTEKGLHMAKHATSGVVRGLGTALGVVAFAQHAHHLFEAVTGDARRDPTERARIRENYGRATAQMASGVLPPAYVQERIGTHQGSVTHLLSESRESLRMRLGSAERAESTMQQFQTEARHKAVEGQEFAAAYDLRSPDQLDALRKKDASFRERFASDLAFAEGVRSMVWLGQHDPAEFAGRQQSFLRPSAASSGDLVRQMQAR